MFNLLKKNATAFGLDISGSSIKMMQLRREKSDLAVRSFFDVPVPKGLIINDEIMDAKTFSYLLQQALERPQFGHADGSYAVVSLPESKSFVRVIQIPKMSEAEADSAVPFEAESFIPMPLDQVYLDWQKIGDTLDKMLILIIATPKVFVDKYLSILDKAGLKTAALEVEAQSCHRALVDPKTRETVLLVDLDAYRSSLIMVDSGNLQFTSTIPIAGDTFTESVAKSLGISGVKAESIKREVGVANTPEHPNLKTSMLPVLNNLSAEIKNILKFHAERSSGKVSKILLVGGTAKLKNLAEFLAPDLREYEGLTVELGNPWINLQQIKDPPLSPYDSLGFSTVIGLSIRGLYI
ncbi:MAG: hypothetical protein COT92_02935 [Candidatus Doudnabacteria bacterium CG10_big_fil_rev_8_21_14_0_10_42_18]|uniref:SHS2 domain-containing protein n=1 Tax=Candidatus Doudnabacteria bacterium CG10_big_fil_rev_8_21_14_0_10_42_18 TaxID=1974552 RepID=A0A2H0VAI2_9BACT|nr:MAG: hypothetical protein COT92_02935 [Candidatus Doudnabacteria bacterium CG10_big_fil_rev_8_21_14_0_10_42_18]